MGPQDGRRPTESRLMPINALLILYRASGYLFGKVGKAAAGALGGSLLLITVSDLVFNSLIHINLSYFFPAGC